MKRELVIVMDFGGQYNQLVGRSPGELCEALRGYAGRYVRDTRQSGICRWQGDRKPEKHSIQLFCDVAAGIPFLRKAISGIGCECRRPSFCFGRERLVRRFAGIGIYARFRRSFSVDIPHAAYTRSPE
mgnify:CR=1 FL=1